MQEVREKFKDHIEVLEKIRESVNETSRLINELGDLPPTDELNLNLMYIGLHQRHLKVIEMFLPVDEEECTIDDEECVG